MADFNKDPIINAIHQGIKGDIEFNHSGGRLRSTLLLVYSAIDTMAFLNMPDSQTDVTRKDFMAWTEEYLRFPGKAQISGPELYGARCGILHTYSEQSKMSRDQKCRMIMHVDKLPGNPVRDAGDKKYIMVSIAGLKSALFTGIDTFLIDIFSSLQRAKVTENRLKKLLIMHSEVPGTDHRIKPFLQS